MAIKSSTKNLDTVKTKTNYFRLYGRVNIYESAMACKSNCDKKSVFIFKILSTDFDLVCFLSR